MNYSKDLARRRRWFRFNYSLIIMSVLVIITSLVISDWKPSTPAYYATHATDYLKAQQKLLGQPNLLSNSLWVRGGLPNASLGESQNPSGSKTYRLNAELDSASGQTASIETSPLAVAPSTTYVYRDIYLSSVPNYLEVEEFAANRTSIGRRSLDRYPTATSTRQYAAHFTTSPATAFVVVRRIIDQSGRLSIENQKLVQSPYGGFKQGMVTITFDGGFESTQQAAQELQTSGLAASYYVTADKIGKEGFMGTEQLQRLLAAGNDIGSNGMAGRDLSGLSMAQKDDEIAGSRELIANKGLGAADLFAAPYGKMDGEDIMLSRRYYRSQRNLEDQAINYPYTFDPFAIKAVVVDYKTDPAYIANLVKYTQQQGGWLVLVYHGIGDESSENPYQVSLDRFKSHLNAIVSSSVPVMPMSTALQEAENFFKDMP